MKIDIYQFKAAVTAIEPELLPDQVATECSNVEVQKGSLSPIKQVAASADISTNTLTDSIKRLLFRDGVSKLVVGEDNEKWQVSPLAEDDFDRIYITSDSSSPKVASYATLESKVDLGLEIPLGITSVTSNGTGGDVQARSFLFVEESQWGELSAPCPATLPVMLKEGGSITLNMPDAPASGHWTKRRVYVADYSGSYRYYATIDNTLSSFVIALPFDFDVLGETLDQLDTGYLNNKPRPTLKGLTLMPGGYLAGYDNNVIAFSKQYLPHAWPAAFEITIDGNIQAMEVAASGLVVLTDRNPYLISGGAPESMYPIKLDITEPCIAPKAVVDMGAFVIYPGNDGLYAIAGEDNRNLLDGLMDKDGWRDYVSSGAVACLFNGKYWCFTDDGGFVLDVATGSFSNHGISAQAVYADALNDKIYLVDTSGNLKVYSRQNLNDTTISWKSKVFNLDGSMMSCAKIMSAGDVGFQIDFIYRGSVVKSHSVTAQSNESFRLPAAVSDSIQFTVSGTSTVKRIQVASTMSELAT